MEHENRYHGKVKWFNYTLGFGFIVTEKLPYDVFIHYSDIPRDSKVGLKRLYEGQAVSFEVVSNGRKGYMANNLQVADIWAGETTVN